MFKVYWLRSQRRTVFLYGALKCLLIYTFGSQYNAMLNIIYFMHIVLVIMDVSYGRYQIAM